VNDEFMGEEVCAWMQVSKPLDQSEQDSLIEDL